MNLYDRARQELAMPTGTRDELIAAEAFVIGVHLWGLPAPSIREIRKAKAYEKTVKKEGKQLKKRLRVEMTNRVNADPGKYKIVFPTTLIIWLIVRIIVGKLIEWMVQRWLAGHAEEILEARAEIFKQQDET